MESGETERLCSHVILLYSDMISDLIYCDDGLMTEIESAGGYGMFESSNWDAWLAHMEFDGDDVKKAALKESHFVPNVIEKFGRPTWLSIAVHSRGMGCGPIFETVYVVYDLER